MSKRELERRLADLDTFADPRVDLEQYPTPPDLAAHLVHLAGLQGDLDGRVLDLGSGTGVLGIAAALAGASVVGVELDPVALATARENAARAGVDVAWIRGDATELPLCPGGSDERPTVLANPPFGAQDGNRGADRRFLESIARLGGVSYSIHNAGSRGFVESFAADEGGSVTHAFEAQLDLERQFDFHAADRATIPVEVFRIEWVG